MTPAQALEFVRAHGIVRESGTGPLPTLTTAIAGAPVRGSWWSHARGREMFALTRALRGHPEVLVCRLADRKITYVHRRLWPALVRAAGRCSAAQLARVVEVHGATGSHRVEEIPYPTWVPREVAAAAAKLDEEDALAQLGAAFAKRPAAS
jgi:hypothetical protein